MPIFQKACFCMSLLKGAQIFGYLGALISFYHFVRAIFRVAVSNEPISFMKCNVMFMQFLLVVAALCLVCATIMENRKLVLPWLIVFWPAIIFLNGIVLLFSYDVMDEVTIYHQDYRVRIFMLGNLDGFGIYVWLCIFSYYQLLKYDSESGKNLEDV